MDYLYNDEHVLAGGVTSRTAKALRRQDNRGNVQREKRNVARVGLIATKYQKGFGRRGRAGNRGEGNEGDVISTGAPPAHPLRKNRAEVENIWAADFERIEGGRRKEEGGKGLLPLNKSSPASRYVWTMMADN